MRYLFDMFDDSVRFSESGESWIQIMKTGKWQHPKLGPIEITAADLHQFKDNYDKGVRGTDLAVDVSHKPDDGAVAWFKELKVDGDKLFARVKWTEEGEKLVKEGKYRYFSPEFMFNYKDAESGKQFKDVLLGGAITNRPFLKNMEPIEFSEGDAYGTVWFGEESDYDPDGDKDDDSTTDPGENPDWMLDVMSGITPWPTDEAQAAKLVKAGATKEAAAAAFKIRQKQLGSKALKKPKAKEEPAKMSEGESGSGGADDKAKAAQLARAKKYGIKVIPGGSVTKPGEFSNVPDDKFADPVNYAYPVDADHVMAAYRYFAKAGNQEKYSPEERKIIAGRIIENLPEKYKGEAQKTFKFEDGSQNPADDETGEPTNPNPIDDVDAGEFKEPAPHKKPKKEGEVKMTEENKTPEGVVSFAEFQAAQDRIKFLEGETRRVKLSETVNGFMFSEATKKGKILPAQKDAVLDLMMGMSDEQVAKFTEVVNGLPDAIAFGEEKGFAGGGSGNGAAVTKSRDELVTAKMDELIAKGHSPREAIAMAEEEVPEVIK